jgi:replicative DNA helicase
MMYHLYIEGSREQFKFLSVIGIFGKRAKILPGLLLALSKISPNTNTDVIPQEAWKTVIEPVKEAAGIGWRQFQAGINTKYCGSTIFKHGISRERMLRIHKILPAETILRLATSDILWDRITSIKKLGVEDVYDATVEDVHDFVANDIFVHNSLEQDSDVVMFIYREDRDRRNSERKNIADILISKHRNGPIGKIELYFDEERASFRNLAKTYQENTSGENGSPPADSIDVV